MSTYDQSRVILPAQRGWFVCEPVYTDGVIVDLHETEVIAWCIDYRDDFIGPTKDRLVATSTPIVQESLPDKYLLKHPDGTYEELCGIYGLTRAEAIAHVNTKMFVGG